MKKFLTIAMAVVFVLTVAAVTHAVEWKLSGDIRNRTAVLINADEDFLDPTVDGFDHTASDMDMRYRVYMETAVNEHLGGTFNIEAEGEYGDPGDVAEFGGGNNVVNVSNALVWFKVPGLDEYPTTITAGLQPIYLGRFSVDDDGAGVTIDTKLNQVDLRLQYWKELEGTVEASDDIDGYGARITVPLGDLRAGLWGSWSDHGNRADAAFDGTAMDVAGDLYYAGFMLDGKIGPVGFEADIVVNSGSIDYAFPITGATGAPIDEEEYSGYMAHVTASMPVGDKFEVGGVFMYASGDDLDDRDNDGELDGFRQAEGGASFRPTQVYYGSSINASVGLDSRVGSRGRSPNNIAGDWLVQGFIGYEALDWLKLTGAVAYIGDNVDNGDRFGTALDALGNREDNDDAGIELDATAEIEIYKELKWRIGAGILLAGDALEQFNASTGVNEDPDDPWVFVTNLTYKF
jgi:hypothetical protein